MRNLDHLPADPPLRAVRAFEATARLGAMAAAAEELGVTPSAISHQLSLLETFLQLSLLRRNGRGVQLTDPGRRYYRYVRSAFAVLRDATGELREGSAAIEIKVSSIPLFATGWLIRNLPDFLRTNPDVSVNVTYANHQNYFSDPADLSIRFGSGTFPGYTATKLLPGHSVPVCSSAFLRQRGPFSSPADLLEQPLIHDQDRSGWSQWFELCHLQPPVRRLGGAIFEDGQLATAAAVAGLGVALLRQPFIAAELQAGSLVQLFDRMLDDERHYFLCLRTGVALSELERNLSEWLVTRTRDTSGSAEFTQVEPPARHAPRG